MCSAQRDEEMRQWVEADLRRLECQRAASAREMADAERIERARLEALMPVSARLAELFRDAERRTRQIRGARHHEVNVCLRQPTVECVEVSLRWGKKFGLTEAERHLMAGYARRRRRLQRYPEVVVGHEYHELSAVLDGLAQSLRLGSEPPVPISRFIERPAMVESYIAANLRQPRLNAAYFHRSDGYQRRGR